MSTTLGCKDIGIKKSEFVTKTQFLIFIIYIFQQIIPSFFIALKIQKINILRKPGLSDLFILKTHETLFTNTYLITDNENNYRYNYR